MVEPWWWNPVRRPLHTRLWKINTVVRASQHVQFIRCSYSYFSSETEVFQNQGQVKVTGMSSQTETWFKRSFVSVTFLHTIYGIPTRRRSDIEHGNHSGSKCSFHTKTKAHFLESFSNNKRKKQKLKRDEQRVPQTRPLGHYPGDRGTAQGKMCKKRKTLGMLDFSRLTWKDVCIFGLLGILSMWRYCSKHFSWNPIMIFS